MPDKLLKSGLLDSAKIGAVPEFAELLFVRLILATCHAGRCPWDPEWIRTHALQNRPRKRLTEIAAALETLRRAHLVTRYTGHDCTPYLLIPNHGQRLKHAVRSPWPPPPDGPPDTDGQTFMALPGSPPPLIAKEPKAGRAGRPPLFSSTSDSEAPAAPETEAAWLGRLAREWPGLDIADELREARRKKGRRLERVWFEREWLPRCSERVGEHGATAAAPVAPEPEAWRQHLKDRYPGESWAESAAAFPWAQMPAHWRDKIAAEMRTHRAA